MASNVSDLDGLKDALYVEFNRVRSDTEIGSWEGKQQRRMAIAQMAQSIVQVEHELRVAGAPASSIISKSKP